MYAIRDSPATASANRRLQSTQRAVRPSSELIASDEGSSTPSSNGIVPSIVSQFRPISVPQPILPLAKRKKFNSELEYTVPNKVTVSEESVRLCNSDFFCRICLNLLRDPHIIPCGHSYCHSCIKDCNTCPVCKEVPHKLVPNKLLDEVVEKFKRERELDSLCENTPCAEDIIKQVQSSDLDVRFLLNHVSQMIRDKDTSSRKLTEDLETQAAILSSLLEHKKNKIKLFEMQVDVIKEDLRHIENKLVTAKADTNLPSSQNEALSTSMGTTYHITGMQEYFNELGESYIQARMPDLPDNTIDNGLESWGMMLSEVTKYKKFRMIGRIFYGDLVSSIDFDKNQELFAAGGQQIKVYNYRSVVESSGPMHYSLQDINFASKTTSLSFNSFFHRELVSSCCDGAVILSDVCKGTQLRRWTEHQNRCWSVHCNQHDPKIIASGSDDFTVKLWASNMCHSVSVLNAEANVCAVRFHPTSRNFLSYGCADHNVYYLDIRNTSAPLCVMKGHKKTVHNCHFINNEELVSVAIDGEMKLWNVNTAECLKTYTGHKNRFTFVGLGVNSTHMVCGSEDNTLYGYSKHVSQPITAYKLDVPAASAHMDNLFVCSVCWKPHSWVVLAATNQGYITALEFLKCIM